MTSNRFRQRIRNLLIIDPSIL